MNYQEKIKSIQDQFSEFKIINKRESNLMIFFNNLIKFFTFGKNQHFMTKYVTTIGSTVYVPDEWYTWGDDDRYETICHEFVHIKQYKEYGYLLFFILYLFLPFPIGFAYFRATLEMEAYAESLRAIKEKKGIDFIKNPKYRNFIIELFTGPAYGWMMLDRKFVENWYDEQVKLLAD